MIERFGGEAGKEVLPGSLKWSLYTLLFCYIPASLVPCRDMHFTCYTVPIPWLTLLSVISLTYRIATVS